MSRIIKGHTPGKWEVASHGDTPGNTSIEVQTETGLPVAVMSYCGRAMDNAVLIAAVPELLEALRAFIGVHDSGFEVCRCDVCDNAKRVIAKVEGGGK